MILALAGLRRLSVDSAPIHPIPVGDVLPAPGQGIICLERRRSDQGLAEVCKRLNDRDTALMASAERQFLATLGGSCDLPVGALAHVGGQSIELRGEYYPNAGKWRVAGSLAGPVSEASAIGQSLAKQLLRCAEEEAIHKS